MASKSRELQRIIHLYRQVTGEAEIDMHKVAEFAVSRGYRLPKPISPLERLARDLSRAAREETKIDEVTGNPYRVNHVFPAPSGQGFFWGVINEMSRKHMVKSLINRREQMVDDGMQLTFDSMHWNRIHPDEDAIVLDMDLNLDIEWRMNASDEGKGAA